jgi:hypothetical protein
VGKQEIITGMEDGSLDSPYCSSTGAGNCISSNDQISFVFQFLFPSALPVPVLQF